MNQKLLNKIDSYVIASSIKWRDRDHDFYLRLIANATQLEELYFSIYQKSEHSEEQFLDLVNIILEAYINRNEDHKKRDEIKRQQGNWYLSNQLCGMSLYVDRFCGKLNDLPGKFGYLKNLGVNLLHLMPVFESPSEASDGGYAVSDFRSINPIFGNIEDLKELQKK